MSKKSLLRRQLMLLRPILNGCSLATTRKGQEMIGRLMPKLYAKATRAQRVELDGFCAAWVRPHELTHRGVVLYLHGGGYTCDMI